MSSKNQKPTVVGLGELLWDMLPDGRQLGGAPANFAYHAQSLGARSLTVSCVGADAAGDDAVALLAKQGLDTAYISRDPDHPTGAVTVVLSDAGIPSYTIHEGVAWDFLPASDRLDALAESVDVVCYGSLAQRAETSRATIRRFLEKAPAHSLRIFDVNLRQNYYSREVIATTLRLSNALKLNDEELPVIADLLGLKGTEERMIRSLIDQYELTLLALTLGSKGALLVTANEWVEATAHSPESIGDTVGAGDSFTAALAMGVVMGRPLAQVADRAGRLAGYVCSRKGAMPDLPEALKTWD